MFKVRHHNDVNHKVLVFLLLTLNIFRTFFYNISLIHFEQVNVIWVHACQWSILHCQCISHFFPVYLLLTLEKQILVAMSTDVVLGYFLLTLKMVCKTFGKFSFCEGLHVAQSFAAYLSDDLQQFANLSLSQRNIFLRLFDI